MTAAFWRALPQSGALADLSDHVRLRLTGPDAVRYLNGQVTNDVRKLLPGHVLPACITNHKGKLEAYVHLTTNSAGDLFISAPSGLRDFLLLRLEKYLIADDCVLEDLTETTALVHLTAPAEKITPFLTSMETPAATPRFGPAGYDLWTTPERVSFWQEKFPVLTPEDQSTLEVLYGIPAWGAELTPGLLPPEAGLDATAIDYHKGCYIGQEVISRLRSVGRVNRQLTALVQTAGPPVERGFVICPAGSGPTGATDRAGSSPLTRTAVHPVTGRLHALAFLHRNIPSSPLPCGEANGPATAMLKVRKSLDD